mgnify:CR=1 FL=1
MKLNRETAGKFITVLCLVMVAVIYLLSAISWSPPDTQIEEDFAVYWEKISKMFTNATLIEKHIIDKKIRLQTVEVTIKYAWERGKIDDNNAPQEHHDSEIKFIYQKQGDNWKLLRREDLIFF